MSSYKTVQEKMTIADAISAGYGELQCLRDEMRDWADNLENGNLGSTQKFQDVSDCADMLDSVADDEPDYGGVELQLAKEITVGVQQNTRKGRGPSRAVRCGNACAYMQAGVDAIEALMEDMSEAKNGDENSKETLEELRDHVQNAIDEASGAEFPGMY